MQNEIKIPVSVSSNGTADAEIKKAQNLKRAYDEANQSATRLGGTAGSRAAAAKAAGGSGALMSGQEYGQMRGAAGSTGASARDFANQAQGLGGLVRVYATFAANIFAVSAAFNALKQAADVSNLVKGLNTLGAASGQNLGALSKRLVDATDGAISFREAMTAVAQTSSAGLSQKNIERLTMVAKNASIALGVAMPDALNRLSRGVVKLEPELLDELGLFTKIGPATEQYALQLGKTASQLTDFERRQAFANAVIEEGEKKFQALNSAASNPYDRLLASLKNVATDGLNLVNKVLIPIVDLLATSPTALTAGLVGIAGILLKQALPALGQFKAGLAATAKAAGEAAAGKAGDAKAARDELNKLIKRKAEESADEQLAIFEKLEQKLLTTSAKGVGSRSALIKTLKKDILDVGEADISASEKSIQRLEARAKKPGADPGLAQQAALQRQVLDQLKLVIRSEEEVFKAAEKKLASTSQYARVQKAAADYELKASKDAIVSTTAYRSSLIGVSGAWQLAQEDIKKANLQLGFFGTTLLQTRVAAASLVGIFATVGAVINKAFAIIAGIAAVFTTLDVVFAKNTKEVERFDKAIGNAEDSVQNAIRTLEAAKSSEGFGTRTLDNTIALSNAFIELNSNAKESIRAADMAAQKAGTWDKFWDGLFSLVGLGREQKLAKTLADQISTAFTILGREGLDQQFSQELKGILGNVNLKDIDAVSDAFQKLGKAGRQAVTDVLEKFNNKLGNTSSLLQEFKQASEAATKSYKEYVVSLADNNPLIKVGQNFQNLGLSIIKLSEEGIDRLAQAFEYLAKNPSTMAGILSDEQIDKFTRIRKDFESQKRSIDATRLALQGYREEVSRLESVSTRISADTTTRRGGTSNEIRKTVALNETQKELESAREIIREVRRGSNEAGASVIKQAADLLGNVGETVFRKGSELIAQALQKARQEAGALVASAISQGLTGAEKVREDSAARREELSTQLKIIDANIALVRSQYSLTEAIELSNALQNEANLELKLSRAKESQQKINASSTSSASDREAIRREVLELTDQLASASKSVKLIQQTSSGDLSGLSGAARAVAQLRISQREQQTAGLEAQRFKIGGQLRAEGIVEARGVSRGELETTKQFEAIQSRILQADNSRLGVLQSIAGVQSEASVQAQVLADNAALEKRQKEEIRNLNQEIAQAEKDLADAKNLGLDANRIANYTSQLQKVTKIKVETEKAQEAEKNLQGAQNKQKILAQQLETLNKQNQLTLAQRAIEDTQAQSALDYRSQELQAFETLYGTVREVSLEKRAQLDLDKNNLEQQRAINTSTQETARLVAELTLKRAGLAPDTQQYKDLTAEIDRQNNLGNLALQRINLEFEGRKKILDLAQKTNLEQERYNNLLTDSKSLAEGLGNAFGQVGQKVGGLIDAIINTTVQNQKNTDALKETGEQIKRNTEAHGGDDPLGPANLTKALEDQNRLRKQESGIIKQSANDQIAGNLKILGSTKALFKEKTGAYKAIAALEKAMFVAKLAMDAKEIASGLAKTGATIAQSFTRALAYGKEAIASALAAPFPINFVSGAAMAAIVAALLGSVLGGGSGKVPAGITAEERQKVQGTGQQYVDGKLVNREGGVFGDPTAKADSIVSAIDSLSEEFFGMLGSGSSKIIQALSGIKDNTAETVKALLGSSSAFLKGGMSSFGTVEGSSKQLWGLWGSTSTAIADAGLRVSGTLDNLSNSIGAFKEFETVIKNSSSWFGLRKSTTITENEKALKMDAQQAIAGVFKSMQDALIASVTAIEGAASPAIQAIKNIPIDLKVSLKGLSGEEAVTAILSELSVTLNQQVGSILPYLVQFRKVGEELFETAARLVKTSEMFDTGLKIVGKSLEGLAKEAQLVIEQALAKKFGDEKKAADIINTYYDQFLTPQEKFRVQYSKLAKVFSDLNKPLPQTREQFRDLIAQLDISKEIDQDTFVTLLSNADAYNDLLSLQSELLGANQDKLKDFTKSLQDFKTSLLVGSTSTLTPIERYAKAKTEFETLRAKALTEGEGQAEAISQLQSSSQTFLNISRELFASGEQYVADFNAVLASVDAALAITTNSTTVEQKQLTALNESLGYLSRIDSTLVSLLKLSDPATPTTPGAGTNIPTPSDSTTTPGNLTPDTFNDIFPDYPGMPSWKDGIQPVPRASGGLTYGSALVGELGPEYVDFATPGRVYSAQQTRGMFASNPAGAQIFREMVNEVQELRQEVAQLRKEQQKQTGDMIITNYDAQQKMAEQIADAVVKTVSDKDWQAKNTPTIK